MKNLSFFSGKFNINETSTYTLSLQLENKRYSYVVIDAGKKNYIAIKHINFDDKDIAKNYTDKIHKIFSTDAFLIKNYKTVNFNFVSQKTTLIPKPLFDKLKLKYYFEFNHNLEESEELHFNFLPNAVAYNVFAIPGGLTSMLINRFSEVNFFNQASNIIERAIEKTKASKFKTPLIHIDVKSDFIDIAVVISGKLMLYNTFTYKNKNDIIYFALNIFKQLNFLPANSHTFISGDISEKSNFFIQICKYIPNIKLSSLNKSVKYVFKHVPEHLLYDVLNLHLCE